jgi:two-component system phosphate regulon sensor histidine kinase PhoR
VLAIVFLGSSVVLMMRLGRSNAVTRGIADELETAKDETLQERSKLISIMSHLVSGVIVIDKVGRIILVNHATEELLGISEAEIVGRWHWEAGHHYGLSSLVDEAIIGGEVQKREVQLHKPKEMTIEAHVTPIRQASGSLAGAVVLLHDVTEWKRLEHMRSDFVANVSHELRTPITALKGFAETLLDGALSDQPTAMQFIEIMREEADRLGRLVEDLLDLSRIEAKQIELHLGPVDAEWLLQKIVDINLFQAHEAGVQLTYEVDDDGEWLAYVDGDRLQQILMNLVSNALQFTPAGGKITLSVGRKDDRLVFAVEDTGVGIPAADISRVFERFYRVDKARSRQSGGTGLGLSIVRHLVEAHGGHVGVSSQVNQGSRFFFDVASLEVTAEEDV